MKRVAAIVLAAGRGLRFGSDQTDTKLTMPRHGVPLVRRVVETALRSHAVSVLVVTGHGHARVEAALADLDVGFVRNADYASGLASSIKAGLSAVGSDIDGVLMMLGDMPLVASGTLDALIDRFVQKQSVIHAVVPTFDGKEGNPVLLGNNLFGSLEALRGDEGARRMLAAPDLSIEMCEVSDRGILIDVDTQADLAALRE